MNQQRPKSELYKYIIGLALLLSGLGLIIGFTQDIWGWWYLPVALLLLGLWLNWHHSSSLNGKPAGILFKSILIVLGLLAVASLAFVIWFSGFEF